MMIWIAFLLILLLILAFFLWWRRSHEPFAAAAIAATDTRIVCTSTFPQNRNTTNVLAFQYIQQLQANDWMLLSGIYIDMDPTNPNVSFKDALMSALQRGAKLVFLTDPYSDESETFSNSQTLQPFVDQGAQWFHIGPGGSVLHSHIKFCDFVFVSQQRGAFYYGSYNPFSPVTAEAGVFVEGSLSDLLVAQSVFRDQVFLQTYYNYNLNQTDALRDTIHALSAFAHPIQPINTLPAAHVIYPAQSVSQCVWPGRDLTPSTAWSSVEAYDLPISALSYSIGFMPTSQLAAYGVPDILSARKQLMAMLGRAQRYIKMAMLFVHFSDEYWTGDDFQMELMNTLRDAFRRGVFIALYIGIYNDQVDWLDKPHFGRFLQYITDGRPTDTFKLFVYPSFSLHFKFYTTERDTLISNNMPHASFYVDLIQGVDICFRDCPEINAFFDNLFNGFAVSFSDIQNAQYLAPDALYSIPQIATRTNLLLCGNDCFQGDFGCCVPNQVYPFAAPNPQTCRLLFVPSYADDPFQPANFFSVMLGVIHSAQHFILLVNQFVQLGCDADHYATLSDWAQTPQRQQINQLFYQAFSAALARGVLIFIAASQNAEGAMLNDTLSPSLRKLAPAQVFTTNLSNLGYIYKDTTTQLPMQAVGEAGSFVHDKLYITDQFAYVGGQNWYPPLELDAGFLFAYGPIYFDLLARAQSIMGLGYCPFQYTRSHPFQGPILDMATRILYTGGSISPCVSPSQGGEPTPFSTLAYSPSEPALGILEGYLQQLATATGNVDIFCWTLSPIETYVSDPNQTPYFIHTDFINAILAAAKRPQVLQITLVLCIVEFKSTLLETQSPSTSRFCTGQGLSSDVFQRYRRAYQDLYQLLNVPKVNIFLEGMNQDQVPSSISSCNLFHAKIIASDTSISASSANFTPGYFFSAANSGVILTMPAANQIGNYADFRMRVMALANKTCQSNCGTQPQQPCLRTFRPTVNLQTYCQE